MAYFSTKTYGPERGLSCVMRQWAAQTHCALLHGYSLGFRFVFAAEQLDARGWVIDFGKGGFGPIRDWLHRMFDHTLLVAGDDPARPELARLAELGLAEVRVVPGASCEQLARFVFDYAEPFVRASTGGRCWVVSVECSEHGGNSALFENPEHALRQVQAEVLVQALDDLGRG